MAYEEHRLSGGLNNKASPDAIGDDELLQAWECAFDESGAVASRKSRRQLFDDALLGEIKGEGDAVLEGTRYRISKASFGLYLNDTVIGALVGEGHISLVVYNNYAYIADGTTFQRYSLDKGLQDAGYETPTIEPLVVFASGGSFTAGTYRWAYTFFNGVAESNFSPFVEDDAADSQTATITVPIGPPGTIERRIYRTDIDGEFYFFIGKIEDNSATEFEDVGGLPEDADQDAAHGDDVTDSPPSPTTTDSPRGWKKRPTDNLTENYQRGSWAPQPNGDGGGGGGGNKEVRMTNLGILCEWTDHDPPPSSLRHLKFLTETVYGIVDDMTLGFSKTSMPEYWSIYDRVLVGRQAGEVLKAIEPLGADMICYTDAGVWRFRRIGVDATESVLERADSPVGLAAEWAVADVYVRGGQPAGHLFLATSGLYLFDGKSAVEVSTKIEKLFTDPTNFDYVHPDFIATASMASLRDLVVLSYQHSQNSWRVLFIDAQDPENLKFSIWRQDLGKGFTTLHRDHDNRLIAGTEDGYLYELMVEGTEEFTWWIKTKFYPMTGSTTLESEQGIVIDADLGGLTTVIEAESNRHEPGSSSGVATWTINDKKGRRKYRRKLPTHFRGDSISIRIANTGSGTRKAYAVGVGYESEDAPA